MDYSRQMGLLDPRSFAGKSVTIIGAGATGSHVALQLAMMGFGNELADRGKMKVFDFDVVEEHNLANQAFGIKHIGMPKVEALKDVIKEKCGFEIEVYNEKVVRQQTVRSTYVFLLVDTMAGRKEIFQNCLKYSTATEMVIETRMGVDQGRVYAFPPYELNMCEKWENSLYSDEDAPVSACGASESIIPTVYLLSSLAVWRFIEHFDRKFGGNKQEARGKISQAIPNELIMSVAPEIFVPAVW